MTTLESAERNALWEPRRELTLLEARKRSQLIWMLRRVFVGAAGAALASVFVFMAVFSPNGGFWGPAYGAVQPLRVINPRFTGTSTGGEAYQLTADVAEKVNAADRMLILSAPVYRSVRGHTLVAPRGVYDELNEVLRMDGGVLFSDTNGNRFSSPGMTIDVHNGLVRGVRGVTGAGPLGVVRADTYEIRNRDRAIVLSGRVSGQMPETAEAQPGAGAE